MARLMSVVRMKPDAPTSAPPMISTLLLRTKPVAAAARPEAELSSAITTGMSAPPMGRVSRTPRMAAATTSAQNGHCSDTSTMTRANQGQRHDAEDPVDAMLDRGIARLPAQDLLQLAPGHRAAGEGQRADKAADAPRRHGLQLRRRRHHRAGSDGAARDERRGSAAEPVECRHQLGHGGHVHPHGENGAQRRADAQSNGDQLESNDLAIEQGHDDRHEHAQRTEDVSAARAADGCQSA